MKVDTRNIPIQGLSLNYEQSADQLTSLKNLVESRQCEFHRPITIQMDLIPMRDFIRAKGKIKTMVRLSCVRCLEIFEESLHHRFALSFSKNIPKDLHHGAKEGIELTAQQIGMVFFEGDEMDFAPSIGEQVVLALPIKPLCSEKCKGLCPHCGKDLNVGICQCDCTTVDGPFASLKNLKLPPQ